VKVFYLHWDEEELEERIAPLVEAGHEVSSHWSTGDHPRFGDELPEAFIISLERLPSHGRRVAEWLHESKRRRAVPLIFAGGKPEKVAAVKDRFPEAIYCEPAEVVALLTGISQTDP